MLRAGATQLLADDALTAWLTRLIARASAERKRFLGEAGCGCDLAVEIPLYGVTKLDAVPTRLHGFTGNPTNTGPFWNVHAWTLQQE